MASITDIENAIVDLIAVTEPDGYDVRYFAGNPFPKDLEEALAADQFKVTVFPSNVTQRLSLNLGDQPQVLSSANGSSVIVTPIAKQRKWFEIHVWTNTPESREAVAEALRIVLDETLFLTFPDGTKGYLKYVQEFEDDSNQEFQVYHRTYFYSVEYLTTKQETVPNACQLQIENIAGEVVDVGTDTSVLVDEITNP